MENTSDKGNERDTLLYGNMQKGVFLSFLFRYNKKNTVFILKKMEDCVKNKRDRLFFAQLFVPQASQSSQDRRAELDVRLAIPSAQSACGMENL